MRPCRPIAGLTGHRAVARDWLRNLPAESSYRPHGLFLAVAAVVQPGEVVLTEPDRPWHHRSCQCARIYFCVDSSIDEQGISTGQAETACKAGDVRALVMIPTLGNPTSHSMA